MERLKQEAPQGIVQTKRSVDWLVDNTTIAVFDPVTFEGYQRSIVDTHCDKIVKYLLEKEFYLPTPIICALDGPYSDEAAMRIVDGQHRVEAFRRLKKRSIERFEQIAACEIPVIVLERSTLNCEIDTFITINKTSKNVDTSLALVLKSKLASATGGAIPDAAKRDYIAVEVARLLDAGTSEVWKDAISFEGRPRKGTFKLISLNAFVSGSRGLISCLEQSGHLSLDAWNEDAINDTVRLVSSLLDDVWNAVYARWPQLGFDRENRRIIQGSIGYSAISKYLQYQIGSNVASCSDFEALCTMCRRSIDGIGISYESWMPGGYFSQFTSGSGYSYVAKELISRATP